MVLENVKINSNNFYLKSKLLVLSSWNFHSPSSQAQTDKDFKTLNKLSVKEGFSTSKVSKFKRMRLMKIIRIFANIIKLKI